jgi:aldehyde dehydrogenase (NAD+)
MGPLVSASARDEVAAAVEKGLTEPGMRLLAGDSASAGPAFLSPMIVEAYGDGALWTDELFGPVLTLRRARDDLAALELVNDSVYGLSAAVFTDNLRAVDAAIDMLDVGVLHINSETAGADPHVPFGGNKDSGYGPKEQGRGPIEFYTDTTTVYLRASGGIG